MRNGHEIHRDPYPQRSTAGMLQVVTAQGVTMRDGTTGAAGLEPATSSHHSANDDGSSRATSNASGTSGCVAPRAPEGNGARTRNEDEIRGRDRVRGATFYIVVGRYAGWGVRPSEFGIRFILGWVSIAFMTVDMESMLALAVDLVSEPDHGR